MYMAGLEPKIQNLYPKIEYPVSRATPSLHQLVHWQHEQDIPLPNSGSEKKVSKMFLKIIIILYKIYIFLKFF